MKRIPFKLLLLGLLVMMVAVACERPIPREETPTPAPPVEQTPLINPTPVTPEAPIEPTTETTEGSPNEQPPQPTETPSETSPTEPITPPTETPTPPSEPPTTETTYTVQPGDTLFSIALRFNTTVAALAAANNIVDVNSLEVGQVLTIPTETADTTPKSGEQVHIVQPGENLFRIGLRYGFTVDELAAYNGIEDPNSLEVGQVIRIPPSDK